VTARRRRKRGRISGAAVILTVAAVAAVLTAGHAVIGAAFAAGTLAGAVAVLAVLRPRLSVRVSGRARRGQARRKRWLA
jgi:hypothetical protein